MIGCIFLELNHLFCLQKMDTNQPQVLPNNYGPVAKWILPAPPLNQVFIRKHRVSLLSNPEDFHAVLLASLGMSAKVISAQTGLSVPRIYYRLRKAQIRITHYRNGTSPIAQMVIEHSKIKAARQLTTQLHHLLEISG